MLNTIRQELTDKLVSDSAFTNVGIEIKTLTLNAIHVPEEDIEQIRNNINESLETDNLKVGVVNLSESVLESTDADYHKELRGIIRDAIEQITDEVTEIRYCKEIYNLVETLEDDILLDIVKKLERRYVKKDSDFFVSVGQLLEWLIKYAGDRVKTSEVQRNNTTYETFKKDLDKKFATRLVKYGMLQNKYIYNAWTSKFGGFQGKQNNNFKADLADAVLKTNLAASKKLYPDFFDDIFYLYQKRNNTAHVNEKADTGVTPECLDKLIKVVNVIFDVI